MRVAGCKWWRGKASEREGGQVQMAAGGRLRNAMGVQRKMATGISRCDVRPGRMNVVMGSMKDRYGLYGYGGLGEWF